MRTIQVKDRQTLMDLAIEHCGSVEDAFDIAVLNSQAFTAPIETGTELNMNAASNDQVTKFFQRVDISPATGDKDGDELLGGIGFMEIGFDFKVS